MRSLRLTLLGLATAVVVSGLSGCTLTNPDKPVGPPSIQQPNTRDVPAPLDQMAATSSALVGFVTKGDWADANTQLKTFAAAWEGLERRTDVTAPASLKELLKQNLTETQSAVTHKQQETAVRAASALNGSVEAYLATRLGLAASALREINYFGRQTQLDAAAGDWAGVESAAVAIEFMWARIYSQSLGIDRTDTTTVDKDLTTLVKVIASRNAALVKDSVADIAKHTKALGTKLVF